MLFTQFEFIFLFLPVVLIFASAATSTQARLLILIAASLIFYSYANWHDLFLLFSSITINYYISKKLREHKSPALLLVGIALNLGPLIFFKYFTFLSGLAQSGDQSFSTQNLLPLGISFYTFIQIAFLVDIYRAKVADPGLMRYSFFVSFFPHLIAGPVIHHAQFLPQIDEKSSPANRSELFLWGLIYFVFGLVKKLVIANSLAPSVNAAFDITTDFQIGDSLMAVFGYTFQLYFDFSAYSDMAIGLAAFFGFRFPKNFESPYKASSLIDFWRRWHITLSTFFRDYVYIPLGGNKKHHYVNVFVTFAIAGGLRPRGWRDYLRV